MALLWDENRMATGHPMVDAQHKEWIARFNEFDEAIAYGKGGETILKTLSFLREYAEIHFSTEEEAMALQHNPALFQNLKEHQMFRDKLDEIEKWVQQSGVSSVEIVSLQMDLEDWVEEHICTIDIQLRGQLNYRHPSGN